MHARWAAALVASTLAVGPAAAAPKVKDKPLPGFSGLVYRDVASPDACAKQTRVVRQTRKGDDAALVKLLTWPRITGLDFPPDEPTRQRADSKRFEAWFRGLTDLDRQVSDRQVALAHDGASTPVARVEAAARLVLAEQQLLAQLGGIDIPPAIRALPDVAGTFCDAMAEHTDALAAKVSAVRSACQRLIADGNVGPGWWTDVCALPAAAPSPSPTPALPPATP